MGITSKECIEEDNKWGLQAIVHPPPSMDAAAAAATTYDLFHSPNFFDVSQVTTFGDGDDDDDDDVFVGFSSSNDASLEDELYKPSLYFSPTRENEAEGRGDGCDHGMKGRRSDDESSRGRTPKSAPKYKKRNRKNDQNRVVIEVGSEELCKDQWAWRKYGQKPIKGSPYPRSYYRCSSSKGCLARKQVERSNSKAGTFVVTYTAEHSHSQPTRRNSLAGTIRNKFITLPPLPAPVTAAASSSSSNAAANATPPRLLIPSSVSDPLSSRSSDHHNSSACNEEDRVGMQKEPETMVVEEDGEDFFAGLEDLDGLLTQFCYPSFSSSHDQYNTTFSPSMFSG